MRSQLTGGGAGAGAGVSGAGGSAGDGAGRRCLWATIDQADPAAQGSLYPQLRAHRKGLTRRQVAADQRARIHGAMIESVVRRGYEGSTVAEIARLGGVSTRTVYERFDSKEGCLLATCEVIAGQAREKVSLVCDAGPGVEEEHPLVSALDAFARAIARHPKEASFVLVHAPTAGAEAYRRVARAHALCAEALAARLEQADDCETAGPLVLGAVHGVSHVVRKCLLDGRADAAVELLPALRGWLSDCASAPAAGLGSDWGSSGTAPAAGRAVAGRVSAGRGAAGAIAATRGVGGSGGDASERLPRIAAELAARDGYRAVSVGRICAAAEIDVDEFLALFASPEDCLLAAREILSVEALASALQAIERRPRDLQEWCDAVGRALSALLARVAEDPALQSVGFLEPIGSEGVRRRVAIMSRFADVLSKRATAVPRFERSERAFGTSASRFGPPLSDAVVGAFWGVVQEQVLRGQAQRLPSLAAPLAYLVLCPIVGPERASEAALRADRPGAG